jgi:hypothetical protein
MIAMAVPALTKQKARESERNIDLRVADFTDH